MESEVLIRMHEILGKKAMIKSLSISGSTAGREWLIRR